VRSQQNLLAGGYDMLAHQRHDGYLQPWPCWS